MTRPLPMRQRIIPAGAAMAVAAVVAGGAWFGVQAIAAQPTGRVIFLGDVERVDKAELDALAQSVQAQGAGGASLGAIREAARRLPWVREASVRKSFPDVVEITLQLHEPLARWGDERLVSTRGELFHGEYEAALPRFVGPSGTEAAMAAEYAVIAKALAPLGVSVRELHLSARGAWQVVLPSGHVLEIGRGETAARVERFVAAWPWLQAQAPASKRIDLRYANGFAMQAAAAEARK